MIAKFNTDVNELLLLGEGDKGLVEWSGYHLTITQQ